MFKSTKKSKLVSKVGLWALIFSGSLFAISPIANAAAPTKPVVSVSINPTIATLAISAPLLTETVTAETATATPTAGGTAVSCTNPTFAGVDTSTVYSICAGLTSGTQYTFQVNVTNIDGTTFETKTATYVAPVPPVTPPLPSPPGIPSAPIVTPYGASAVQVSISALTGDQASGFFITGNPGGYCRIRGASGSCVISGLTTGATYIFTATAYNFYGVSVDSVPSTPVLVGGVTAPGTPSAPSVLAGNTQATVTVYAPTTGGAPSYYQVNSVPAGHACTITVPAYSCVITGLTNGASYSFTTQAFNATGGSAISAASAAVIPNGIATPSTPVAVAGNAQATVSIAGLNSGSAASSWRITSTPGNLGCTITGASGSCTVTGLTNGTAYTFKAVATTAAGQTAASAASNSVTPGAIPSTPSAPTATPGDAKATVRITPLTNAGTGITYKVTSTPGSFSCLTGSDNSCVVTGLTNGTSYTFYVVATNSVGSSAHSPNSAAITPVASALPPAPTAAQLGAITAYSTLTPGQRVVLQNNQALNVTGAASSDNNSFNIQGTDWKLSAGALTSTSIAQPLNSSGNLSVSATGKINLIGTGYKPNSTVYVYIFSTPTILGAVQTDSNGGFTHAFAIPTGIANGNHVLQINGATALNQIRSVSLGFSVGTAAGATTPTPTAVPGSQRASVKVAFASGKTNLSPVAIAQIAAITTLIPGGAQNVLVTLTPHIGFATPTKAMRAMASARVKKLKSALIRAGITGPFVIGKAVATPGAGVRPSYVTVLVNWTAA